MYAKAFASLLPPTQRLHQLPPCGVSGQEGETAPALEHAAECGASADGPQWSGVHSQSSCEVGQSSVSGKGETEGGWSVRRWATYGIEACVREEE